MPLALTATTLHTSGGAPYVLLSMTPRTDAGGNPATDISAWVIHRDGTFLTTAPYRVSAPGDPVQYALTYEDGAVAEGQDHFYSVGERIYSYRVTDGVGEYVYTEANFTTPVGITVGQAAASTPPTPPPSEIDPNAAHVIRWRFVDVWQAGPAPYQYTFHINPNEGGTMALSKSIVSNPVWWGGAIVQEGNVAAPDISFSGSILTQQHLEALEDWFQRRVLIDLYDDLGRVFRGAFASFQPKRIRRAFNPWFHTFDATFAVQAYRNASGVVKYGRFV